MGKKIALIFIIIILIIIGGILIFLNLRTSESTGIASNSIDSYNSTIESTKVASNSIDSYSSTIESTRVASNSTDSYSPTINETTNNENTSSVSNIDFNRTPENVKIAVDDDSVTKEGVTIIITDNNEEPYGYGADYNIEKKSNDIWEELTPKERVIFNSIAYSVDENHQLKLNIDWSEYYGSLENGTYRIVKTVYDDGEDVKIYSDEFKIK